MVLQRFKKSYKYPPYLYKLISNNNSFVKNIIYPGLRPYIQNNSIDHKLYTKYPDAIFNNRKKEIS